MVIGRSVSFSDPARPPGGGVGRPKHPKIPPSEKKNLHAFQNPMNIFEKKNLVGKKNLEIQLLKISSSSRRLVWYHVTLVQHLRCPSPTFTLP